MFNGTKDPWKAKGAEIKSQWERCEDKWEKNKENKITLCCIGIYGMVYIRFPQNKPMLIMRNW